MRPFVEGHDALRQRFRRASRRNRTLAESHLTGRTNKIMRRHGGMFRQTNDHATPSKVQLRRSSWAMKMVGSECPSITFVADESETGFQKDTTLFGSSSVGLRAEIGTFADFLMTGLTNKIMRRHGGMFRQTNDHATHSKVRLRRSSWAMKMVGSGARPSRLSPTNPKQDSSS